MAISPPSDIVMDVARAADPAAAQAARARLSSLASQRADGAGFQPVGMPSTTATKAPAEHKSPAAEAFQKFEAVVLQTFIQSMLPKDTQSVYGQGMAGAMWPQLVARPRRVAVAHCAVLTPPGRCVQRGGPRSPAPRRM